MTYCINYLSLGERVSCQKRHHMSSPRVSLALLSVVVECRHACSSIAHDDPIVQPQAGPGVLMIWYEGVRAPGMIVEHDT